LPLVWLQDFTIVAKLLKGEMAGVWFIAAAGTLTQGGDISDGK